MVSKLGAGISGGLSGAATGAALGSVVPGIGTGLGAIGGGLIGGLGSFLSAQPERFSETNLQTPEQKQILQQILGNLQPQSAAGSNYQAAQGYLGQLLSRDPAVYDRFAAPYLQQFQEQTIPQLTNRFARLGGPGGGGALSSSGFAQALGAAGSGLQANLASLFGNLQQGAANQSLNQYNQLAALGLGQRAFQPTYQQGTEGLAGGLGAGLGQAAGTAGTGLLLEKLFEYLGNRGKQDKRTGIDQATGLYDQGAGFSYNPYTGYQGDQFLG